MIRLCAWCAKRLGGRGREVSHGICRQCFEMIFQAQFDFVGQLAAGAVRARQRRRWSTSSDPGITGPLQEHFSF
jgi:hypothetical protein